MTEIQNTKRFRPDIRTLLVCIVLAMLVFIAFEGVRHNDFINYDDDVFVVFNPQVQQGLNLKSVAWAFTSLGPDYWHPLPWISHIIDYSIFGANPAGHHLASVGFHIANVLLLFLILKSMTGTYWRSVFVAAVFGLHPLAVESVAWIAERKDVLSTFFSFLTIAAYIRYTRKPGFRRYAMVVVMFAAGLLSKPMLVTLPFVLMLLDFWPLHRLSVVSSRRLILEKVPLLIMSLASCVVTYAAATKAGAVADVVAVPWDSRAYNAVVSYIRYIGKIFYPASLAVLYPREVRGFPFWQVWACFLLLAIMTVLAVKLRRKHGWLFTGWFWYLGMLVPVIGLVQVGAQSIADRFVYLPGIGIYIIVAWLAREIVRWRTEDRGQITKIALAAGGVIILAGCLLMTKAQVRYWKDSLTLYERTLAITKDNYVMHAKYGNLLRLAGRTDEATWHLMRAVEIRPIFFLSHGQLALLYRDKGMFSEAAEEFETSIKYKPDNPVMRNHYGVMLLKQGMYEKAMEQFKEALISEQYFSGILYNFCNAGVKAGKLDEALIVLEDWQRKKPKEPELYYRAGMIYKMQGNNKKCVESFEKAMELAGRQNKPELVAEIKPLLEMYRRTERGQN